MIAISPLSHDVFAPVLNKLVYVLDSPMAGHYIWRRGWDWFQVIKLNWNSIFSIQEGNPQLQKILDAHKDILAKDWVN